MYYDTTRRENFTFRLRDSINDVITVLKLKRKKGKNKKKLSFVQKNRV